MIVHLITRGNSNIITRQGSVEYFNRMCYLRGHTADLIVVDRIKSKDCQEFLKTVLEPIVVARKGKVIFLEDEL